MEPLFCYSPLYPSSVYDYDFYHLFYVYGVIVAFRRDVQCEKNSDDELLNLLCHSCDCSAIIHVGHLLT